MDSYGPSFLVKTSHTIAWWPTTDVIPKVRRPANAETMIAQVDVLFRSARKNDTRYFIRVTLKIKICNAQEMAPSERNSDSKNRGGKN